MTPGVLILTGQTASGKSALAHALAARFDLEIIGADSRQIYRGMPIGTAAPTEIELARVAHHLVGFLDPHERYSAARFVDDALAAIDAIHARGRHALVVGGTGFYLRALAGDVTLSPAYDAELRSRLAHEAVLHPAETLHAWLTALDPARAAAIAPNDPYRVTRALEIALTRRGGAEPRARTSGMTLRTRGIPYRKLALTMAPAKLEQRITTRIDDMLASGLLEEAERIGSDAVAADAVGYREVLAYLSGWSTFAELRAHLIRNTRRYAKRQATWLRSEPDVTWLQGERALAAAVDAAHALGWEERSLTFPAGAPAREA